MRLQQLLTQSSPALSLTKSALPVTYNAVGQTISYTYTIRNSGNVTLDGPFSVADDKATVSVTQPVEGELSPNEECTATATYTITQADLDAGSVTNIATATNGTVTSGATATVNAVKSPALSLTKSALPVTYNAVGQTISYTYTIRNSGNVTLDGPFSVATTRLG